MDTLTKNFLIDNKEKRRLILDLLEQELTDEYGYPTDAALEIITLWPYDDITGWFYFIRKLWHMASWGWNEDMADTEYDNGRMVYVYEISTGGWSGNESLIHAMHSNMLWGQTWVQSRRGGHYIFEREIDE